MKGAVREFADSQRFYNAGYEAGRRAAVEALMEWLETSDDRGDHEFGWKDAVRAEIEKLAPK